jgi:hypothetical protein
MLRMVCIGHGPVKYLEHMLHHLPSDIEVRGAGCEGSELAALDPMVMFFDEGHISHEDTISQEQETLVVEFRVRMSWSQGTAAPVVYLCDMVVYRVLYVYFAPIRAYLRLMRSFVSG